MNISELRSLSKWFIETNHFINLDEALKISINYLDSAANSKRKATKQERIRAAVDHLLNTLKKVNFKPLSDTQMQYLESVGLSLLLSKSQDSLSQVLHLNGDPNISAGILKQSYQIFLTAKANFTTLLDILPVNDIEEQGSDLPTKDGKILTRLHFDNGASISNVVEFQQWASKWHTIGRGFSMANGHSPEDMEVVGAGNGSILVDLLANIETINMIGEAINHLLDAGATVIETKVAYEGLKKLRGTINNQESQKAIDAAIKIAEDEAKKKEDELHDKVAKKLLDSEDESSSVAELRRAVKELDLFIASGGDIQCICNPETKNKDELNVANKIEEVNRKIEVNRETLSLEDKKNQSEDS
ncbi:hypothetical protein [Vibrio sp. 10N.261.54.A5]|uniref:hypothetical protein n=1 Tax=Vibrio sp. 10N.261.54.A5 TaxID=3229686 RepID=UPI00355231CB